HTLEQWVKEIRSQDRSKGETAIRTVLLFGPERAYKAKAVQAILGELTAHLEGRALDVGVRVYGTVALGLIVGHTEKPDPKLLKTTVAMLGQLAEKDSQALVRFRAAEALGVLGPRAEAAIPALTRAAKEYTAWEPRQAAVLALGKVGFDATEGPTATVT